ncbi:Na+/H+ antiporter subunit E [Thiocapsa rosea]|uniref:Multicomponent Na+:H+ antiporter subunit E n=1 Tax=Thiocapsa rosea TaxID=69360 RepID=A0A495V1Z0_9GAMM|nr:Na+/H+ antiporter subunit E [Thiocapsa rosea]RKT43344.1 multicomponent Na+:H+ antiporter subunit E [Thiocapsa rosea]
MQYSFLLFLGLLAFWLLLSGLWDEPLLLGLGLVSSLIAAWLGVRMDRSPTNLGNLGLVFRLIFYWRWLLVEIVKSNIDVVRCIWQPRHFPISPGLAVLPLSQRTVVGRVIYAQSITLTPGTVAIELGDGEVQVHALTQAGLEALRGGEMDRRVTDAERAPDAKVHADSQGDSA